MKGQSDFTTKRQHEAHNSRAKQDQDTNRNSKQAIGTIYQVDPNNRGLLTITAWVPRSGGGRRLWGDGREITIVDSPMDIILRFGQLVPGMVVKITWRGVGETSRGYAQILSEASTDETVRKGDELPLRNVDTQSSLPFEPFGF